MAAKTQRVLILAGADYEDLELHYPRLRLIEAGCEVVVAGPEEGALYPGKNGYPVRSEAALRAMRVEDFQGLVIPGGWMPDKLRRDPVVLDLVRGFDARQLPIASICHGPWIDISAGIVRGVRYTSTPGIKDDLTNAGAEWIDAEVCVDRHHVSSRRPDDLPAFCRGLLSLLEEV